MNVHCSLPRDGHAVGYDAEGINEGGGDKPDDVARVLAQLLVLDYVLVHDERQAGREYNEADVAEGAGNPTRPKTYIMTGLQNQGSSLQQILSYQEFRFRGKHP